MIHDTEVVDSVVSDHSTNDEEKGVEIIEEDSNQVLSPGSQDESNPIDQPSEASLSHKTIVLYVCHFVSFIQLCYKFSASAVPMLLEFIHTLLFWIALVIPNLGAKVVRAIGNSTPRNVYFVKRHLTTSNLRCVSEVLEIILVE